MRAAPGLAVVAVAAAALSLAGAGLSGGCDGGRRDVRAKLAASASSEAEAASQRPIEMFSWWERVGDGDALGALIKQHQKNYPSDVIINASAGLSGRARKTLQARMQLREPPDTFQANVGADLMQWVLANRADARETKLLALDGLLPEVVEWRRTMPAVLLDQVSYEGKMYGVPSNVHRLNSVFYNKKIFTRYGLVPPTSVADFRQMSQKLKGTGVALLAVGSREPWTLALLTFECLLVAREGPAFYGEYLHGKLRADDPRVLRTLEAALELGAAMNPDHPKLNWLQAVELVVRGEAAMTVMGDWATMFFNAQGAKSGIDYVEIPFPGTEQIYVFTSDAFALPVEAKNRPGAERLLATIGSVEGQRAVSVAKGALSPRSDVVPPAGDTTAIEKKALWQKGALVLALSGIVPPRFSEDVGAALAEMLSRHDIEVVVHTLRSRYALLK